MHNIMAASSVAPGANYHRVMELISSGLEDPVLGKVGSQHVQLCPQHPGKITEEIIDSLMELYPSTRFRVHATPRVQGDHVHHIVEAVNVHEYPEQINATAKLSRRMNATGYTLHAGQQAHGTLEQAFENTRRLADLFKCRVGIEGLYPSIGKSNRWLLSTWEDHEKLLEAKVDFAIDLSHLNIVAKRERKQRPDLVEDLLTSEHCIECHVSDNDARADIHQPLNAANIPWWMSLLNKLNSNAILFYEGIIVDPRKKRERLSKS